MWDCILPMYFMILYNTTGMSDLKVTIEIIQGHRLLSQFFSIKMEHEGKGKDHPCTGTEALYRPYGP